jgi:hypothetical protein
MENVTALVAFWIFLLCFVVNEMGGRMGQVFGVWVLFWDWRMSSRNIPSQLR